MIAEREIINTIKRLYRYDRLEGRDNDAWGKEINYSQCVISSRLEDIRKYGSTFISRHESVNGCSVIVFADGTFEYRQT